MKLIEKLTQFTSIDSTDPTAYTHGIHPYPAKFIPELPREIIRECTKERNIVLDPFCGSGTTLLEACVAGRKSIGIDSNPIATLISRAKTTALTTGEIQQLSIIIDQLEKIDCSTFHFQATWIPKIQNLNHWFQASVINELSWLKQFLLDNSQGNLQNFLLCIFSSIIVNVSNQESNTRYAAIEKSFETGSVIVTFLRKLRQEAKRIVQLSEIRTVVKNTPIVYHSSTDKISSILVPDSSVDIVITSPPYANSYDYYLYHKWRMAWLGYDMCLSIRNCIKRAPKSTVPGQHRFGFEKPCFCSL